MASDMWMGTAPSENRIPAATPVLKLEEDPSWSAPSSTKNLDIKVMDTQNFKEVVEHEWYSATPEPSLLELSSYNSMLDPSLNFDTTTSLISSSFRSAPDDHQGSSAPLLSSISPGPFTSGLPTPPSTSTQNQTRTRRPTDSKIKSPPTSNDSSAETGHLQHLHKTIMDASDEGEDLDDVDEISGDGGSGENGGGKPERPPAKNLMAERRRRKKLNDRLYMLRSVVPKITKMDRASILRDAIEYLKELLQRINDIKKELLEDATLNPTSSNSAPPKTPQKEECLVLPNPESQPPRVEVLKREGEALNIHMFCARRPGLLLNTVRALDAMGLDVQQAVISCFNGFALDLFRAEAQNGDIGVDEIKAVLLLTAGCGMHPM